MKEKGEEDAKVEDIWEDIGKPLIFETLT